MHAHWLVKFCPSARGSNFCSLMLMNWPAMSYGGFPHLMSYLPRRRGDDHDRLLCWNGTGILPPTVNESLHTVYSEFSGAF